ncbi:hypothetical protein TKK_0016395 [Trichogramma kaykai]
MNLISTVFSFLFLFVSARNVAAGPEPFQVVLSGLDVFSSLNNPNELFKSLVDFVSLISSNEDSVEENLSVIRSTLTDINNKLDVIAEDLQGFREEVISKLEELKLDAVLISRLDDFFKNAEKIDLYYARFTEVSKAKYPRAALDDFVSSVRTLNGGVRTILTEMHNALSLNRWTSSAFNVMSDNTIVSSLVCSRGRSQQLIIYNFYKALCAAELKGITMDLFAIKKQMKRKQDMIWEINNMQIAFTQRSNQVVSAVKKAMSKASREFWRCNSSVTFEKVGPFIYKSFEPERGLKKIGDPQGHHWCVGDCPRFSNALSLCPRGQFAEDCNKFAHNCPGYLKFCESFDSTIRICNSPGGSQRKYEYVEGYNGKFLGKKGSCARVTNYASHLYGFHECQICLCTCENPDKNLDIYVNLREVVSDVYQNKVIVGIRLKKIDGIFYLQIQEAVLLPSGTVDPKTKSWARINTYKRTDGNVREGVDYFRLSWDHSSVELDDIVLNGDSVVTGVKFTFAQGLLRLEVRGHRFDYKQGKLKIPNYSWHRNIKSTSNLSQLGLTYLDLPSDHSNNPIHSYPGQYVTLRTSSLEHDVGQSIIPFVDIDPVELRQPAPLSGIGLFHKSYKNGAAGYLTLKILNYDYEPYVKIVV